MDLVTPNVEQFTALLRQRLNDHRYEHSLAVAQYAADLARCWGRDERQAYAAGLVHDLYHSASAEELLSEAQRLGVTPDEVEQKAPSLLHGPVAAAALAQDYGVTDPEILEAVRVHTLAAIGMGQLAQIIYVSDKVEPTRPDWPGQSEVRHLARVDLERAVALAIQRAIAYVNESGQLAHPTSRLVYEDLLQKIKNRVPRRMDMQAQLDEQQLTDKCAQWAAEKKGRQIVSISLHGLTLVSDYFLIITATNTRQAQTMCDYIEEQAKALGQPPLRIEGYRDARWILLDLGGVVVHIFQEDERNYYDLERLWADGAKVEY